MNNNDRQFHLAVNDRVHLSEIRTSDKKAFVRLLDDPGIYKQTLRIPHPYTEADADRFLAIVDESTHRHGYPTLFAVRQIDGELIGGCGFDDLAYGHRAEMGYWLAKPFWGQGIMTNVVRAICDFAFEQWKLVRISAHVFDGNTASARVLEKCGFQFEGLLRKHHLKDGKFIDSRLYALVK